MIPCVIGFPGSLFDDDPFGVTAAAPYLWIDIILPIATSWKAPFSILELTPADIARKRRAVSLFQSLMEVVGFLWSGSERRTSVDWVQWGEDGVARKGSDATLGIGC